MFCMIFAFDHTGPIARRKGQEARRKPDEPACYVRGSLGSAEVDEGLLSGNVTGRVRKRAHWRVGAQIIRIIVVERKWSDLGLARKCELK